MYQKWIETTVGVFLLAAVAALLMLALKVSGLNESALENKGYIVTAYFNNAGGLKPKAKVTIAGVSIGRVMSVELDPHSFIAKVALAINPSKAASVPNDTRASILTAGLLGDNYVGLTPGFSQELLKAGDIIPETQTDSAIVLEDLISRFVSGQASQPSSNQKTTKE